MADIPDDPGRGIFVYAFLYVLFIVAAFVLTPYVVGFASLQMEDIYYFITLIVATWRFYKSYCYLEDTTNNDAKPNEVETEQAGSTESLRKENEETANKTAAKTPTTHEKTDAVAHGPVGTDVDKGIAKKEMITQEVPVRMPKEHEETSNAAGTMSPATLEGTSHEDRSTMTESSVETDNDKGMAKKEMVTKEVPVRMPKEHEETANAAGTMKPATLEGTSHEDTITLTQSSVKTDNDSSEGRYQQQQKQGFLRKYLWLPTFGFLGGKIKQKNIRTRTIDMTGLKNEIHEKGVAGIKEKLSKELDSWSAIELHTAVTGNSGTGKSSFINAIRGLRAYNPGAAAVGVNETTTDCQMYRHPENRSFVVWDLPGVGTPEFPKDEYFNKIELNTYDFFVIISKGRFTENDLWLALKIQKLKKTFFFVRSCIDQDIENDRRDNPSHDGKKLITSIRERTESELQNKGVKDPKVFLISNHKRDMYDFGKLIDELMASCDGLKKDMLALSLAAVTQQVLEEKKRILKERIPLVAKLVVCSKGEYEEEGRFHDEIKFYQKQFNIDDVTLAQNKELLSLSDEKIKEFSMNEKQMKTPTAMRQAKDTWDRFMDCFTWSKENTLLYMCCTDALASNLDTLYDIAYSCYDVKATTNMVHTLFK